VQADPQTNSRASGDRGVLLMVGLVLAVAGVVCGGLAFAVVTAFTVYVYAAV
jgi:hypothetical protein